MQESWNSLDDIVPALRRFLAERCRDENELDDIIQETLVRAARHRSTLSDPTRLRSWAFRIGANVLADRIRSEMRMTRALGSDQVLHELPCPHGEEEVEMFEVDGRPEVRAEVLEVLSEALTRLEARDRRLIDSYYGGAGSCREVAEACDLPRELVKVRLFRARGRLRTMVAAELQRKRLSDDYAGQTS